MTCARESDFLGFTLQGALQCLIESGLVLLVFLRRDLSLLAFEFEFEQLFFQSLQEHGRRALAGCGRRCWSRRSACLRLRSYWTRNRASLNLYRFIIIDVRRRCGLCRRSLRDVIPTSG